MLVTSNNELLAENARLRARESYLMEENVRLTTRVTLLEGKLDALCRRLFGAKSEKMDQAQLLLLLGLEAPTMFFKGVKARMALT